MTGSPGRLRLATLNTFGLRADADQRMRRMRDGFAQLDADLVVLQETIRTERTSQTADILGPGYHIAEQQHREPDGQGISTASRWPFGTTTEIDLHVTARTYDFACTALVTEVLAPAPWGRIWLANHLPDYQLDHERERELQAVALSTALDALAAERPGHVIIAGDMDADPDASSIRFLTGLQSLEGLSCCYRDAWSAVHGTEPSNTFVPTNPYSADWDWPYRSIDHILIRTLPHGGPSLVIEACERTFDTPTSTVSDHYGLVTDLNIPAPGQQNQGLRARPHAGATIQHRTPRTTAGVTAPHVNDSD